MGIWHHHPAVGLTQEVERLAISTTDVGLTVVCSSVKITKMPMGPAFATGASEKNFLPQGPEKVKS